MRKCSRTGDRRSVHIVSMEEQAAFAEWINTNLAGDPRLATARPKYRDPVIEEAEEEGQLKHYRSEEFLGHTNPAYSSLARTRPDMVKSNEVTRTTPHNSTFYFYFLC